MQWLTQNGVWILLAVGFFYMMRRGGCGMGGGMKGHESHGDQGSQMPHHGEQNKFSGAEIDPVNKATLDSATALTAVYHGKIYYFGSAENRVIFEADSAQYASAEQAEPQSHKSHHQG
ncbi:MAG: YHS domain-containing protein [Gallionella sp.]